jgi:hypothetical protein
VAQQLHYFLVSAESAGRESLALLGKEPSSSGTGWYIYYNTTDSGRISSAPVLLWGA